MKNDERVGHYRDRSSNLRNYSRVNNIPKVYARGPETVASRVQRLPINAGLYWNSCIFTPSHTKLQRHYNEDVPA